MQESEAVSQRSPGMLQEEFISRSCGNSKDQNAHRNVDSKGSGYDSSQGNQDYIRYQARDHLCYSLQLIQPHDSLVLST